MLIFKIEDNVIDKNIVKNCGYIFISFSKKKKILFTTDKTDIYLINFNTTIPEVIQKVKLFDNKKEDFTNLFNFINDFYDDDNIYLKVKRKIFKDFSFYEVEYIIQYKIFEGELKEFSRIELSYRESMEENK